MKTRYFLPLLGVVLPTVAIGFAIPNSCIAGLNALTVGFGSSILAACLTYWAGVRVHRDFAPPV